MPTFRQNLTSSVTRRYPFASGCGTFANSRLVRLLAGEEDDGPAWARLDCGAEVLVPLSDYVGRAAFYVGDLDRKVSEALTKVVRPGDHVLDVGANIGVVTLLLARLVGPEGRVDSFEPNPTVAARLARSIERNGFTNVHLHECALGAEEGPLALSVPEHNAGMGSLSEARGGAGLRQVEVRVRTLADVAAEQGFGKVRAMKVDVEGFEHEVFRGALSWLETAPPDVLLFESNGARDADAPGPVLALLAGLGYSFYSLPKRLYGLRLRPFQPGASEAAATHDMLAIRSDCEGEVVARFRGTPGPLPTP